MTDPTTAALVAWADCVQRLIAVAPLSAVQEETGISGGHSTPPERKAIREAAEQVVNGWLERDLAIEAEAATPYREALERLVEACHEYALDSGPERDGDLYAAANEARALLTDANGVRTEGRQEQGD